MSLPIAQLQALKAAIAADPVLSGQPQTDDGAYAVADALNQPFSPAYWIWSTSAPIPAILDAITWANYTPNDVPDNTVTYQNRCMLVQTKQMNLQLMLQGRETIDATRGTIRTGLSDATNNLPTGNNGNLRTGGWANVVAALRRAATYAEKVLALPASGTGNDGGTRGTTTNPDKPGWEGRLMYQDILDARAS
jgi:hypothetical protein